MAIEQALGWAYRQELPKARWGGDGAAGLASNWGAVSAFGALLASVDVSPPVNSYGCVIDLSETAGPPDPDAVAIGDAVAELDAMELALPEGWSPLADLGDLGALGDDAVRRGLDGLRREEDDGEGGVRLALKSPPSRLVAVSAALGRAPDWRAERPEVRPVVGPKGRPRWFRRMTIDVAAGGTYEIEGDGWNERRGRPWPDAYRKEYLDPDPAPAVVARGEYEIWRACLDLLVDALDGRLTRIAVDRSAAPLRPWETGVGPKPRVLRAILPAEAAAPRGAPKRRARAS